MMKTVIHPLQRCDGIEALHNRIEATATELRNGSLRSVREVEVSLIWNGKVSPHSITFSGCLLNNDSHPACPHWSIRDTSTPSPLSVTALCMKQATVGAIDLMPHFWTRSWLQRWRWTLVSDFNNRSYLAIDPTPSSTQHLKSNKCRPRASQRRLRSKVRRWWPHHHSRVHLQPSPLDSHP